jgi:alpha-tubulin suppressor-like RCC1 family protein
MGMDPSTVSYLSTDTFGQISASATATCGITLAGSVRCWGVDDEEDELEAPDGEFASVSTGYSHACGIRLDGTVTCWGGRYSGDTDSPWEVVQISTGQSYENPAKLCELYSTGAISCRGDCGGDACETPDGDWSAFQLGYSGGCAVGGAGVACWEAGADDEPSESFSGLTVGDGWACGLQDAGDAIRCWGRSESLDLGEYLAPSGARFAQVDAGSATLCATLDDASVLCWGWAAGEAGDYLWPPEGSFASVSVGDDHVCALRTDSRVECWGGYNGGLDPVVPP